MATGTTNEVFADAVRSAGDLAGVFEYDGETGYFYLFAAGAKQRVLRALHVLSSPCTLGPKRVEVRWGEGESVVGLFIAGQVWAVSELGERFESHAAAKEQLFDYIEVFYNQQRRHSVLGYMSPAEFERATRAEQSAA